jgi:glutamate N-acetyltransferase / amino-acid N-acetyltransferase
MTTSAKPSELDFLPIPGIRLGRGGGDPLSRAQRPAADRAGGGATCAAVFTRNAFCAAPVVLARRHLAAAPTAFLLINSGNANAGTGDAGMHAAEESCRALAALRGCRPDRCCPSPPA